MEIEQKWGFGMAPPKTHTHRTRLTGSTELLAFLTSESHPVSLESLSIVKGMFNRVWKQDQWDWFTVYSQLGYPSGPLCRRVGSGVSALREAIKAGSFAEEKLALARSPVVPCLEVFLGRKGIRDEPDCGWVYLLSTREFPDLVKVGMTTRSVQERVREISGATGVPIPFGVRGCWRVRNPALAERMIHAALAQFRVRSDREFFRASFGKAAAIIGGVVSENGLEIRTLERLTVLS